MMHMDECMLMQDVGLDSLVAQLCGYSDHLHVYICICA